MSFCVVFSVVDGNTFEVTPPWKWENITGSFVQATGYDAPSISEKDSKIARERLTNLILGRQVELCKPQEVRHGRLVCDVYLNGVCLAEYFPEY